MAEVRAYEHMVRVQIMKVHKVRILPLYSELACACHSAPHPAARDYRRRTKRRRRRMS